MKILINVGCFHGGAPLSILEYAKIAKKYGHEVIAVGEYSKSQDEYSKSNIITYDIPYFTISRVVTNLKGIHCLIKIIKNENPDIIHATSFGIIPSKFISLLYDIPIMYNIAGGKDIMNIFNNEKLIVYSEENKENYRKIDYPENQIEVISNRIVVSKDRGNSYDIYVENKNCINLLMISRLSNELISSIDFILNLTDQIHSKYQNISLKIIGTGPLLEETKKKANTINNKNRRKVIDVLGYKSDVQDYINSSHIVFGKGRSVIEAILNYRIGVVVSEDDTISICTTKTFDNLYKYNFSGRSFNKASTVNDLINIISKIFVNEVDLTEIEKTRKLVDEKYNIKHVEEKIIGIYESIQACGRKEKYKMNYMKAIKFIFGIYFKSVLSINKWIEYYRKKIVEGDNGND